MNTLFRVFMSRLIAGRFELDGMGQVFLSIELS